MRTGRVQLRRDHRSGRQLTLGLSVVAATLLATGAVALATIEPPNDDAPDGGPQHFEVIAQGVVELTDDFYQWTVAESTVDAAGGEFIDDDPTFLLAGGTEPMLVTGSDGALVHLAPGQADFRPPGSTTFVQSAGAAPAAVTTIALRSAATEGGSDPLAPGPGLHDLELLRDVLASGETLMLDAPTPAFVIVTAGSVDGPDGPVAAGSNDTLGGQVALTNSGSEPAIVVVASIGATLNADGTAAVPGSTAVEASSTQPSPSAAPSTTAPPSGPPVDSDGDGLTDDEEAGLGTDPNNTDSDVDGLSDGDEVDVHGTDPRAFDSDGDGIGDFTEVGNSDGLDPNNPDTDGDGLGDNEEGGYGTDPVVADTDGDGANDGDEIAAGTNPADPLDYPGAPPEDTA